MAYSNIKDPSAHFQAAIYTGSNNQSITNDGNSDLQPDFAWIKRRSNADHHSLTNSSLGVNKQLLSSSTNAEQSRTDQIQSFNTDGFTLGTDGAGYTNVPGNTYVAWQWKANGGTTASNTDGSVTSTVQVNQDAGFSIVTWTTGVGSGNHSVGHGLGVKPAMFITKSRGSTSSWWTWHQGLTGDTSYVNLQATTAELTHSDVWGGGITSSVFGYNYPATVYANQPYIAYCFAEKQGYSKFGSYVGNSNVNGTFVYTGFKPAFIMLKSSSAAGNWNIYDSSREGFNVKNNALYADATNAEDLGSTYAFMDILSNGFKLRRATFDPNKAATYIYMAFAESPFVAGGIPTTAR